MGQSRVSGTRKYVLRKTELLDSPEPLEFRRVNQLPGERICIIVVVEHDEIVNGIANALSARQEHTSM